ncbi:peptide ABC transporter permease [Neptunitalea chrysea]|uniref:Peptide ABC transporter permease n=1 Tax=Neptunitalea chrysea TaxID=1647581 RepID=A0A9W6B711_9FLAO|nr:FtsX-like permease family protein [Neptunitalea chrysea]GLB51898.1 peptide ABC transporter permease [Neptunitalea chrysea]
MSLWRLAIKNMLFKPLNTFLSILLLALSVALISGSFHLKKLYENQITANILDIDMVIGAKGSPLQLVLSSVLHIDAPTGNINYDKAKQLTRNVYIKSAVPISYGDNYKGYRIIGSTPEFLKVYHASILEGQLFSKVKELVVGYELARQLHLKIGDKITSSHGLTEGIEEHDDKLIITGILKPTGTIIDQLLITPLETVWHVHEHKGEELEAHEKEITAMLVSFKNPMAMLQMPRRVNAVPGMQAALPKFELDRLYGLMGVGFKAISMIGLAILLVSGLSIFISLYRVIKERKYEIALMRTYGASRLQLFIIVLIEGFLVGVIGVLGGFILSKLALNVLKNYIETGYKLNVKVLFLLPEEGYVILGVFGTIILATLLAVIPIFKMNVSKVLADE